MWPFNKKEVRSTVEPGLTLEQVFSGISDIDMNPQKAMEIPAFSACVELISGIVATLPIKLYQEDGENTKEVRGDKRVELLNDDTGDLLNGYQFKKALIRDYLVHGAGYAYIKRVRNRIVSIHYVKRENVAPMKNEDPIFKTASFVVGGNTYRDYDFLKFTRNTEDGVTGKGVVDDNGRILTVAYKSLLFEEVLVGSGGNKKGFLKAEGKVDGEVLKTLKQQWANLYKNNTENVVVLNSGLDFKEASNTSVEMQLNENKKQNALEIYGVMNVPRTMIEGGATEADEKNFVKYGIMPILSGFVGSLNKELLLNKEVGSFYFAIDTKEIMKGDLLSRYKAYEIASKNGFLQTDEIRYEEDLKPLGLDFIKLGLQDVLYDPKTKRIYTPNTDKTSQMSAAGPVNDPDNNTEGGEKDEDRNTE